MVELKQAIQRMMQRHYFYWYKMDGYKMYSNTLINRLFGRPTYQITISDETATHEFFF